MYTHASPNRKAAEWLTLKSRAELRSMTTSTRASVRIGNKAANDTRREGKYPKRMTAHCMMAKPSQTCSSLLANKMAAMKAAFNEMLLFFFDAALEKSYQSR